MRSSRTPIALLCSGALILAACGSDGGDDEAQTLIGGSAGNAAEAGSDGASDDETTTTAAPEEETTTTTAATTTTETTAAEAIGGEAREGYQRVELEGFSFELPDNWVVISDASEIESITSSPEFEQSLADVDLEQVAGQLDIVDLMALEPTAGDFATNMNVIVTPSVGLSLDSVMQLNLNQLEQAGLVVDESEVLDLPNIGEAWRFGYPLQSPTGEIAIVGVMWIADGDLRQITVSAGDKAASQVLADDIVATVVQ